MAKTSPYLKTLETLGLDSIQDEKARPSIELLLNLVEELGQENQALRAENQHLRDEINRLKGEQGTPSFKSKRDAKAKASTDRASETERRTRKKRQRRSKKKNITIDRTEILRVDRSSLPPDAVLKGYDDIVVQDIILRTDNVKFRKEIFYSAVEGKSYRAEMPPSYKGNYGPAVKALVIALYYGGVMSEPKILDLLHNVGTDISAGQLSNMLIKDQEAFHAEKDAIYKAGLESSPYQHIDDTGTKVNGANAYCHILCNPLYTVYHTTPHKDRLTVIDVLWNGQTQYRLNDEAMAYLERVGLSGKKRTRLWNLPRDVTLDADRLDRLLEVHVPDLGPRQRTWVLEAMAVAAYHAQSAWPVVDLLVADDAGQFKWISDDLALCWVHEGRHYKKLTPVVPWHRDQLATFRKQFWAFYRDLLAYRQAPTEVERAWLDANFDKLFCTVTGYAALDDRIAKTRTKKKALLQALAHPEIPLHNNPAELGARQRVRKRDVSFGPRVPDGVRAWDTFATLVETAKKLGVSFYAYLHDRISAQYQLPSLASLISERASTLSVSAS
jgi:regulator of replication initiation timing